MIDKTYAVMSVDNLIRQVVEKIHDLLPMEVGSDVSTLLYAAHMLLEPIIEQLKAEDQKEEELDKYVEFLESNLIATEGELNAYYPDEVIKAASKDVPKISIDEAPERSLLEQVAYLEGRLSMAERVLSFHKKMNGDTEETEKPVRLAKATKKK